MRLRGRMAGRCLALALAALTATSAFAEPSLQAQIDALRTQVGALPGGAASPATVSEVQAAATANVPLAAFRARYGCPVDNPTIDQRLGGVQRFLLERGGLNAPQAAALQERMNQTKVIEKLSDPFRMQNILLAVGSVAGMNLLAQARAGGGLDLGKALSFLGEQRFWGGFMASTAAYSLTSWAVAAMLPPGLGALVALLPTFAGVAASLVGFQLGSSGKSFKEVLAGLNVGDLLGRAAGMTVGGVMGAQLAAALAGGLAVAAGPLGAVVGSILVGTLGAKIGAFLGDVLSGRRSPVELAAAGLKEAVGAGLMPAGAGAGDVLSAVLPGAAVLTDAKASELKARYSELYQAFVAAHAANRGADSVELLTELRDVRAEYDEYVRGALAASGR